MRIYLSLLAVLILLIGCSTTAPPARPAAPLVPVRLQGAGATFPDPLYQRWITEYGKLHPNIKIDYQAIGSGGAAKGIMEKTIDFAGSDAPLTKKALQAAKEPILHIPTVACGVGLTYNLPDFKGELNLSGPVIAEIYLGRIARWNDARIAALNPGAALPDMPIVPVHRTDGSGTTFMFTNYLRTQSQEFSNTIGAGKQVYWPVGLGGMGHQGLAAAVRDTAGAIGYAEALYATANKMPLALMQNNAGKFVTASPANVAAAGDGALKEVEEKGLPVDLWNQPGETTYPIASFTCFIVYRDLAYLRSEAKARALVDFLWWAIHDGQKMAGEMGYAPLSAGVRQKVEAALQSMTYEGCPLMLVRPAKD